MKPNSQIPFVRLLAALSVALFCILPLRAEPVIEPITPDGLLALLPPHPEGWKLVSSHSDKSLSTMNTPQVSASRKYEVPLDEEGATTTFSLDVVDMGSRSAMVEHLRENIESQIMEKKQGVEAFEAGPISGIIRQREEKDPGFQGTSGPRLIIRATAANVDVEIFKKLLGVLDWSNLALAANRLPSKNNESNRFVVGRVDEMNPAANRSTVMSVFELPADYVPPAPELPPPPPEDLGP